MRKNLLSFFFFSSRRRHTRSLRDWSSDVCSSDLVAYRFQIPEHGSDRMGRERFPEGWLYEVAQWYPRMAVYDDVRGWNTEQYLGQGEFYLEYGDIDFAITVPRGIIVEVLGTVATPP